MLSSNLWIFFICYIKLRYRYKNDKISRSCYDIIPLKLCAQSFYSDARKGRWLHFFLCKAVAGARKKNWLKVRSLGFKMQSRIGETAPFRKLPRSSLRDCSSRQIAILSLRLVKEKCYLRDRLERLREIA